MGPPPSLGTPHVIGGALGAPSTASNDASVEIAALPVRIPVSSVPPSIARVPATGTSVPPRVGSVSPTIGSGRRAISPVTPLGTSVPGAVVPVGPTIAAVGAPLPSVRVHVSPTARPTQPDEAAALAARVDADWVVVPRLNRASRWVTDLQAHIIRIPGAILVSNRIVELKSLELSPELTVRVAERGAAWMADQVAQAIDWSTRSAGARASRRCPA